MLESSAAFAELRQWNLDATGAARSRHGLDLGLLLELNEGSISPSAGAFELDLVDQNLQEAWIADFERSYTRFVVQLATYGTVVGARIDPMWTAVTGYYASFMGATALLSAIGHAARNLARPIGPMSRGLHVFTTRPSIYPGRTVFQITPSRRDSHRFVWSSLVARFTSLSMVDPTDTYTNGVLAALCNLVQHPSWLSDFRNRINYSVDEDPALSTPWASEVRTLTARGVVERRIQSAGPIRDEQRVELVAMACASLVSALYSDYRRRADRPDPRPGDWRRRYLRSPNPTDLEMALQAHLL